MNADKSFVFNPRLSPFIGGHRFGRVFQQALKPVHLLCYIPSNDKAHFALLLRWGPLSLPASPAAGEALGLFPFTQATPQFPSLRLRDFSIRCSQTSI